MNFRTRQVSFPIPALPPVTRNICPVRSGTSSGAFQVGFGGHFSLKDPICTGGGSFDADIEDRARTERNGEPGAANGFIRRRFASQADESGLRDTRSHAYKWDDAVRVGDVFAVCAGEADAVARLLGTPSHQATSLGEGKSTRRWTGS